MKFHSNSYNVWQPQISLLSREYLIAQLENLFVGELTLLKSKNISKLEKAE